MNLARRYRPAHSRIGLLSLALVAGGCDVGRAQTATADSAGVLVAAALQAYGEQTQTGYVRAIAMWAQAAALYRASADRGGEATTLNNIGYVHGILGRPDSSLAYYSQALTISRVTGDRGGEATTLNNIGSVHSTLGRPDSALIFYSQALALSGARGDRVRKARTLNNIASVHSDLGRPDSALAYYSQALFIRRAIGDRAGEATTLNNIGLVHSDLGRPDSALAYYSQALPIRRAISDHAGEATTLSSIGYELFIRGRPDSALAYFSQALSMRRAVGARADEASTLNNIGAVHRAFQRPDSALAYYAQALAMHRTVADRAGEATTLNNIGLVHSGLGRPDSARAYISQALSILRAVGNRSGEANTLANMGGLYHVAARPRLSLAAAYYDSAATVLSAIGESAGGDQGRLSFAEQDVVLFDDWALAWLAQETEAGSRRARLAALGASERGRAQALLALMRRSNAAARFGADLEADGERLVDAVTEGGVAALSYTVTADTLLGWLILPDGQVDVFRRAITSEDLAAHVAALRAGFGADLAAVRSRMVLRGSPELEAFRDILGTGAQTAAANSEQSAERLSEWLLPPSLFRRLPPGSELVIVPHGPLNLLPFASLPAGRSGEPLGIRYSIRYSPSLATLAQLRASATNRGVNTTALVVGDPAMPIVRSYSGSEIVLQPLEGAREEGQWVAKKFGVAALSGVSATEAAIKERLPHARLVHLATHGFAYSSEARARDSFVALAPSNEDDGLLTVGEILDEIPSLSADLVVLSACQTGLGNLKQAEGTVGLQRAFLAKGAQSVLVSLWSVSDAATDLLMRSFYTHWRAGRSKADALRRAQVEVRGRRGSPFHDPRYWAAFQLVGAN